MLACRSSALAAWCCLQRIASGSLPSLWSPYTVETCNFVLAFLQMCTQLEEIHHRVIIPASVPDKIHWCGSGSPAVHSGSHLLGENKTSFGKVNLHGWWLIFTYSFIHLCIDCLEDKQVRYANKYACRQLTKSSLSEQSGEQACTLGFSKATGAFWLWGSTSSREWKGYANSLQRGWTLSQLQTATFIQIVGAQNWALNWI